MPSYTITVSTENATRIKNAIEARLERDDGETDRQMFDRWLRGLFTMVVYGYERTQAEGTIAPDNEIAEIT